MRVSTPAFAAGLFALAWIPRALFVWLGPGPEFTPSGDQVDYYRLAVSLLEGTGYSLPNSSGELYSTAFRPPLFALVLTPAFAVFGATPFVGLLWQSVLGAALAVAVWALGRQLFDETTGRVAGVVTALYPLLIFFSGMLLTETLYGLTLVLAAMGLVAWWRHGGARWALIAGLLVGISMLARPTGPAWVGLVFLAALAISLRPRIQLVREALVLGLGVALVVAPWTIRNTVSIGTFIPLTTGGGCALYDGNNERVVTDPNFRGGALSLRQLEPYAEKFRGLSEYEIDRLSFREAVAFWRENPEHIPNLILWKQQRFWRAKAQVGRMDWWLPPDSPFQRVAQFLDPLLISYGLLIPFFLWGAWLAIRRPRQGAIVIVLAVVAQAVLASLYWGSLRFRVPVEPFLILLAASGAVSIVRGWRERRGRPSQSEAHSP